MFRSPARVAPKGRLAHKGCEVLLAREGLKEILAPLAIKVKKEIRARSGQWGQPVKMVLLAQLANAALKAIKVIQAR
jgi:hypothetical protein